MNDEREGGSDCSFLQAGGFLQLGIVVVQDLRFRLALTDASPKTSSAALPRDDGGDLDLAANLPVRGNPPLLPFFVSLDCTTNIRRFRRHRNHFLRTSFADNRRCTMGWTDDAPNFSIHTTIFGGWIGRRVRPVCQGIAIIASAQCPRTR